LTEAGSPAGNALDLGSVYLERSNAPRFITIDEPLPPDADFFFNAALDSMEKRGGLPRLLFVTSPSRERDAAIFAVGLSRVAARKGLCVLLVDLSIAEPVLAKPFPYQPEEGVTDMVLWGASLQAVLRKTRNERIRLITAGSPPPDPDRFLREKECDTVLNTLRGESELVIIIGALKNDVGEPSELLRKADRTILVTSRSAGAPDLPDSIASERIALATLGEEPGEEPFVAPPEKKPEPAWADESEPAGRERKKVPVVGLVLGFAALSILLGLFFSNMYLGRKEPERVAPPAVATWDERQQARRAAPRDPAGEVSAVTPETGAEEEKAEAPSDVVDAPVPAGDEAPEADLPVAVEKPAVSEEAPAPDLPVAVEKPAVSEEAPAPVTPPPGGPAYGAHVESFSSLKDAENAGRRFIDAGEAITIMVKEIPGKGTWYRVVVGRFHGRNDAKDYAEEIKARFGLTYAQAVRIED